MHAISTKVLLIPWVRPWFFALVIFDKSDIELTTINGRLKTVAQNVEPINIM